VKRTKFFQLIFGTRIREMRSGGGGWFRDGTVWGSTGEDDFWLRYPDGHHWLWINFPLHSHREDGRIKRIEVLSESPFARPLPATVKVTAADDRVIAANSGLSAEDLAALLAADAPPQAQERNGGMLA
jgi:hypothetical protein